MDSCLIYHNPRCSKSRATLSLLEEKNIPLTVIQYLQTPPSEKQLKKILSGLGIPARELLRTGEKEFKQQQLDNTHLTEQQLISAMHKHPKLMERPIVIYQDKAVIGRPPEAVLGIFE